MKEEGKSKDILIIALLVLALAAGAYYLLFYQPLNRSIADAAIEREDLLLELEELEEEVEYMETMQAEVERLLALENPSRVYSYNNSKAEVSALNDILSNAKNYTINFEELSQDGMLIRRSFELMFAAEGYDTAKDIVTQLDHSQYRCLLGDIAFSGASDLINIDLTATFFETMYDGVPDSGLPDAGYDEADEPAE